MRSGKSCCELTLFKKDMARFWPLWAAYTVLWFLLLPLDVFSSGDYLVRTYTRLGLTGWVGDKALQTVCQFSGIVIAFIYGVLCAMAVWSYLYNNRSANMTHALPVRREGHFAAHFLSGVTFFLLPHVLIFILTAVAGAVRGSTGDLGGIAAAMGIQTLLCLFFFCFATLCAFITGHILALPVLYGIVNFLIFGVSALLDWFSSRFLFGVNSAMSNAPTVMWLTPFAHLTDELSLCFRYEREGVSGVSYSIGGIPSPDVDGPVLYTVTRRIEGLHLVLIYAAVGLALAALALLLYRRRHLETAGDVVAVPWLRPVFQYGVAFCAALAGAYVTVDILRRDGPAVLTGLLALWGVVGYFVARMFLHKTLKVFRSGWKGAAAAAAVLLALCAGLWTDVLGLERRVPDAAQVGAVYISAPQSSPGDSASSPSLIIHDPAQIQQILNIHRAIVAHRAELKPNQGNWVWDAGVSSYTSLRIMYYAKAEDDFPFMERSYSHLLLFEAELNDPNSVAYALNEYINNPDVIRAAYELDQVEPGRMTQVLVNGLYRSPDEVEYVTLYSPLSDYALEQSGQEPSGSAALPGGEPMSAQVPTRSDDSYQYQPASLAELGGLWNAVLADFDEGNLGRRWLFYTEEFRENTCLTTLEFHYQVKVERIGQEDYYRERAVSITLTPQARHTLAAMESLGLFEDGAYVSGMSSDMERVYPQ